MKLICFNKYRREQVRYRRIYGVVIKARDERESASLFLSDERTDTAKCKESNRFVCVFSFAVARKIYRIGAVKRNLRYRGIYDDDALNISGHR